MEIEAIGDKLVLKRTSEELAPYKQRLNRIEGQVRGLKRMIEDHRYCGEAIQQSNAVIAGMREVALMLISQQLESQAARMDAADRDASSGQGRGIVHFVDMLRSTYRFV